MTSPASGLRSYTPAVETCTISGTPASPAADRDGERAVEADAALLVAVAAERVDRRHERVRARHDLRREGRVAEVADVLLDAREVGGGAGAAYDRAHPSRPSR